MSRERLSPKSLLHQYKTQILSEVSESSIFFKGAYLLKENIVGRMIHIHALFVYQRAKKTIKFTDEVCFSIYSWIEERKEAWFKSLYEKGYDFSLILYPHFMSQREFNEFSPDVKSTLERKRLAKPRKHYLIKSFT